MNDSDNDNWVWAKICGDFSELYLIVVNDGK